MKAPLEFRIHGMDCADEVAILRREIVPSSDPQIAWDSTSFAARLRPARP